ncbi:unnamed protein product [Moneuplotes crassus]|uniref:Uncharacterized protein n=1 Tax=Euplotes crassus TaxID=5936 RepID=A0AAD1XJT9_EUPCR|nr:unnamed protein product [Moneuplotes crassus]
MRFSVDLHFCGRTRKFLSSIKSYVETDYRKNNDISPFPWKLLMCKYDFNPFTLMGQQLGFGNLFQAGKVICLCCS